MKFGLMYEIQIPEPHGPTTEQERYNQVLAQVDLADEVGFHYFWTVEHHFLREFSHCSAPEVLYGAISQRITREHRLAKLDTRVLCSCVSPRSVRWTRASCR